MRIISGKYKGRQLVSFDADHIRPTTDRVKESQFNILQGDIDGARVLDLFAGTGNLGIEALSRGAKEVCFVEINRKSLQIIEKNLDLLKIKTDFSIQNKDVMSFLKSYKGEPFDVIFVDPPFTEKMAHDVMLQAAETCGRDLLFHGGSVLTIESSSRERIDEDYGTLIRVDQRTFGDKILSFFRKSPLSQ